MTLDFKVGDIITAYHVGFHKVEDIKPYKDKSGDSYIVYYRQVMTKGFKLINGKLYHCNVNFCKKVTEEWIHIQIVELNNNLKKLRELL